MTSHSPPTKVGQVVPHNRWDLLEVPDLGSWKPTRQVSAVIPHYQAPEALRITLAALSRQTYPSELLEVVVVDDGSQPPLELPEGLFGLQLRLEHQDDRGFGLARARNRGARVARGDILVFLDCDMVPEPWQIEAHARWHHVTDHAVTIGFRRHVEFGGLDPDDVLEALDGGDLTGLFAEHEQQWPEWVDGHMLRTDDLTSAHDDLFRVLSGGNLGIRKDRYWDIGGSDESFTQWGAEDTEFGYRAFVAGALIVPERRALCWHQGFGHLPDASERRSLEQQRAKIAHLVAHTGFRRTLPGRSFVVPRVVAEVATAGASVSTITATVEALLGSTLHDLQVVLEFGDDLEDAERLARDLGWDPRVTVGPIPDVPAPYLMSLPAGAVVSERTVDTLVRMLTDPAEPLGIVQVTVPDRRPDEATVTMMRARALGRARWAGADGDEVVGLAGALFGRRWVSGLDVGLAWHELDEPTQAAVHAGPTSASEVDQLQELWRSFERLDPSQRQSILTLAERVMRMSPSRRSWLLRLGSRLVGVVSALAATRRIRSPEDAVRVSRGVAAAFVPARLIEARRRRRAPAGGEPVTGPSGVGSGSAGSGSG